MHRGSLEIQNHKRLCLLNKHEALSCRQKKTATPWTDLYKDKQRHVHKLKSLPSTSSFPTSSVSLTVLQSEMIISLWTDFAAVKGAVSHLSLLLWMCFTGWQMGSDGKNSRGCWETRSVFPKELNWKRLESNLWVNSQRRAEAFFHPSFATSANLNRKSWQGSVLTKNLPNLDTKL